MEPPGGFGGGMGGGMPGMGSSSETETYDFVLTNESRSFTNVSSAAISTLPFSDVPADSWYYDAVAEAYNAGLIVGTTETQFSPDDSLTAAELITMLYRAQGGETTSAADGNWYDTAVAWGEENGIINAGGWTFSADSALTRCV